MRKILTLFVWIVILTSCEKPQEQMAETVHPQRYLYGVWELENAHQNTYIDYRKSNLRRFFTKNLFYASMLMALLSILDMLSPVYGNFQKENERYFSILTKANKAL